jgi:PAS domain S-box-containing protein
MTTNVRPEELEKKIEALEQTLAETRSRLKLAFESEAKFRTLVEDINAVIFTTDPDGRIAYISPQIETLIGYQPSELVGRHFSAFIFKQDLPLAVDGFKKVMAGSVQPREYRIISKNDETLWIRTLSRRMGSKQKKGGIQGVFIDITDRKRAEDALRKSEEKYHAIIENIAEGYFEVDLAGNLTFFNEPLSNIFGYEPHELMGMNNRAYTSPETARKMYQIFNRVFKTGEPATITDYEIFKKDGTPRILELSTYLMQDQEGHPVGFRGFVRDMSERKLADEEKKKLAEHLQQINKMESIGTLANGIAHDFNNLLMGIQGNTALLKMEIDPGAPAYRKLKRIDQCIEDGVSLTRQLLGFAGSGKYVVMPTDLNKIIKHTSRLFGRSHPALKIRAEYADDLWEAEVDRVQIGQALLNLYLNAYQAMPDGGELQLKTANSVVDQQLARSHDVKPGPYVKIDVTDNGEGMDPLVQKRIFEPFFSTRTGMDSAGLGLSAVYGIVKSHHGLIQVTSAQGRGASFSIFLPTTDEPGSKGPATAPHAGQGTVLLVDDEEMLLDAGTDLLTHLGYHVLTAASGREALEQYKRHRDTIDFVILDMIMPDMDGEEAFTQLRAQNSKLKILLSSGYGLRGRIAELTERDGSGFVQKPFNLQMLSREIEALRTK